MEVKMGQRSDNRKGKEDSDMRCSINTTILDGPSTEQRADCAARLGGRGEALDSACSVVQLKH